MAGEVTGSNGAASGLPNTSTTSNPTCLYMEVVEHEPPVRTFTTKRPLGAKYPRGFHQDRLVFVLAVEEPERIHQNGGIGT